MTLKELCNLVLAFARVLYVNGQATEQTVGASERLGHTLGVHVKIMPRWGELQLQCEEKGEIVTARMAANPVGVNMDRVPSPMRAIEELGVGRLAPGAAPDAIRRAPGAPPAPTCA